MTKRTAMRSYKKRRTLRKMKRTMRRKLQRGGGPELLAFAILYALFGKSPIADFLRTLADDEENQSNQSNQSNQPETPMSGGNKFRQSGGGQFSKIIPEIIKFNEYVQKSEYFTVDDKTTINNCVVKLTETPEVLDAPVAVPPNADANAAAAAALPTNLSSINFFNINEIKKLLLSIPGKLQTYINAKLVAKGITGDKLECMNTIISICIRVLSEKIKNEIQSLSVPALIGKLKDTVGQFAEQGKGMLSAFSKSDGAQSALSLGRSAMNQGSNFMGRFGVGKVGGLGNK